MKDIIEVILVVAFVLLMIFLFKGDPDMFDVLHERAMEHIRR